MSNKAAGRGWGGERAKAFAAAIGATAGWGATPVFIKLFSRPDALAWLADAPALDPCTQTLGRYGTALAALALLGLFRPGMRLGRVTARQWRWMALPAIPNILMQFFWVAAFYRIQPTVGNLLSKLSTILSLVFGYVFFADERQAMRDRRFPIAALAGLAASMGLVLAAPRAEWGRVGTGAAMIAVSSVFWALYAVGIKQVMRRAPISSGAAFSVASVYMVAAFSVLTAAWGDYSLLARAGWRMNALLIVSGVVNIAAPHVLFYHAIRILGVGVTSLITLCTSVVTAGLSYAVFGEVLTRGQAFWGLVVMASAGCAVWLGATGREPAAAAPIGSGANALSRRESS